MGNFGENRGGVGKSGVLEHKSGNISETERWRRKQKSKLDGDGDPRQVVVDSWSTIHNTIIAAGTIWCGLWSVFFFFEFKDIS